MADVLSMKDPRVCAAAKLGGIASGIVAGVAMMWIPFGSAFAVAAAVAVAVFMFRHKLPSGRCEFAAWVLGAVSLPAASAATYGAAHGSRYGGPVVALMGVLEANFLALYITAVIVVCAGFISVVSYALYDALYGHFLGEAGDRDGSSAPRFLAAAKTVGLVGGAVAAVPALGFVPFAAPVVVAAFMATALAMNMDRLPSGRLPFTACLLAAILPVVASAAVGVMAVGHKEVRDDGSVVVFGTGRANFTAVLLVAVGTMACFAAVVLTGLAYDALLKGCVAEAENAGAAPRAPGEAAPGA